MFSRRYEYIQESSEASRAFANPSKTLRLKKQFGSSGSRSNKRCDQPDTKSEVLSVQVYDFAYIKKFLAILQSNGTRSHGLEHWLKLSVDR